MSPRKKHKKTPSGKRLKVGISIGDFNGVGMEVIMKTFLDNRMLDFCTPVVYASPSLAKEYRKKVGIQDFSFNYVDSAENTNPKKANLVKVWDDEVELTIGESTEIAGRLAFKSLEAATQDLASNKVDVLVTAPINKNNIQSKDFPFAGHTEYLANYANEEHPLMIMVHDQLRVGTLTGHVPIKDVAKLVTKDLILNKLDVFNRSLKMDFCIEKPKIAVLGLNPHSGDNGTIGSEENDIIIPALKEANERGILALGPFPADGFFGSPALERYDGVMAMYHDQGLTPFKTLSFDEGVNYTAGLPIVRTSPDHGTAYDIAGMNKASERSFRNAVFLALDVYRQRKEYRQLTENSLISEGATK